MTQDRHKQIKEDFPELLHRNRGFINITCKKAGIHRNTYYLWRKEDEKFAEACDEVIEIMGDWVESKLYENIERNDTVAIKFCLSTKFKNRGYGEKENTIINVGNFNTEEDMQILEDYIEKRAQEKIKQMQQNATSQQFT